jgi:hypothetical protein
MNLEEISRRPTKNGIIAVSQDSKHVGTAQLFLGTRVWEIVYERISLFCPQSILESVSKHDRIVAAE